MNRTTIAAVGALTALAATLSACHSEKGADTGSVKVDHQIGTGDTAITVSFATPKGWTVEQSGPDLYLLPEGRHLSSGFSIKDRTEITDEKEAKKAGDVSVIEISALACGQIQSQIASGGQSQPVGVWTMYEMLDRIRTPVYSTVSDFALPSSDPSACTKAVPLVYASDSAPGGQPAKTPAVDTAKKDLLPGLTFTE
ncbi:MAG: hypothetical protein QM774_12230 [Gordonia sp. (in: high G+C Gram-positive bacteria)]|uniref:hypothetical protein n=1 Tax=Gordonia sp. (in: high G+C Gram-positive bacteria) TaxID=84139 RepID=UPI0039E476C5